MIFLQGIDIVNVSRINDLFVNYGTRFLNKILSDSEKLEFNFNEKNKFFLVSRIANKFAAKEAASKALGTGFRKGVRFSDFEISNNKLGKPLIKFSGNAKQILKRKIKKNNVASINISISNEKDYAVAIVTIIITKKI